MSKMYVVTVGEYSDYRICGVFDLENLAQKFIDSFGEKNNMNIEEYSLNPYSIEMSKDYKPFFIRMTSAGECTQAKSGIDFNSDTCYGFDNKNQLYCSVFAKDEKHAIKIVNEKRIQILAANTWGKIVY